jgi:hypothetical protein
MDVKRPSSIQAVPFLGLVLLTSCATPRRISHEELQSDLTSGISLASEARLYLQYSADSRTLQFFTKGHFHYLAEEANRTEKELQQVPSFPKDTQALNDARLQFRALSRQLALLGESPSDENGRIQAMRQLTEIGKAMEQAKDSR